MRPFWIGCSLLLHLLGIAALGRFAPRGTTPTPAAYPVATSAGWKDAIHQPSTRLPFFAKRSVDPLWATVFYDRNMVILVRRTPANQQIIERFEVDWRS